MSKAIPLLTICIIHPMSKSTTSLVETLKNRNAPPADVSEEKKPENILKALLNSYEEYNRCLVLSLEGKDRLLETNKERQTRRQEQVNRMQDGEEAENNTAEKRLKRTDDTQKDTQTGTRPEKRLRMETRHKIMRLTHT